MRRSHERRTIHPDYDYTPEFKAYVPAPADVAKESGLNVVPRIWDTEVGENADGNKGRGQTANGSRERKFENGEGGEGS